MRRLRIGDIAPRLVHRDTHGSVLDTGADHIAGNFLVLVFCQGDLASAIATLTEFARLHDAFRSHGAVLAAACTAKSERAPEDLLTLPFPVLLDVEEAALQAFGLDVVANGEPHATVVTFVLRPNGHVLDTLVGDAQAGRALDSLERARDTEGGVIVAPHPPVLIVPDVLDRSDCEALISVYRQTDAPVVHFNEIAAAREDVKTQVPDYDRRDRIDHMLNSQGPRQRVARTLKRRLLPEIKKAFQYEVAQFEGLRIACYEGARQGRAHGHRDNSQPVAAHRRFAMSLNLNSEEFSGGELRFPEYGPQLYKPATGAAIVFSCSLLHEALEVTAGRRFVLLAFFC